MNGFLSCLIYLAAIGVGLFLLGRILPKEWFQGEKFPFRSFSFEREGNIYHALGVRKWKEGFPDMSVLLPFLMPSKRLPKVLSANQVELMIQETCVAEWVHVMLCIMGFGCVFLWKKAGGWILSILYILGNLPYIVIQRYNRPKLVRLLRRLEKREGRTKLYENDWSCEIVGTEK